MAKADMQAVLTSGDGLAFSQGELIGQLALKNRLPAAVLVRKVLVPGTLLSYGPDTLEIVRRATVYVDRILRARSLVNFPWSNRRNSSSSLISRPRMHSALSFRLCC
jgi:putative ABC transport system substrate-binding protein